jgi:hypothetical protein
MEFEVQDVHWAVRTEVLEKNSLEVISVRELKKKIEIMGTENLWKVDFGIGPLWTYGVLA